MNLSPVDLLLARLRDHQCNPQRSGAGWCARCPAHDDSTASLTINQGSDGRVLFYCHAGCEAKEIVEACGLTLRDTFPTAQNQPRRQSAKARALAAAATAPPAQDWAALADRFAATVDPAMLDSLARELGVSAASLTALGIGWADVAPLSAIGGKPRNAAWVFPMTSGHGEIIGLSARTPAGGKWTVNGGHNGLFVPRGLATMPDPVYVPEGASDTAAALSRGWAAVGRPSNVAAAPHLAALLRGRRVIVVGENDRKPNGKWPGRDGARTTAAKLAHEWGLASVEWMLPPDDFKDLREWHRANARTRGGGHE